MERNQKKEQMKPKQREVPGYSPPSQLDRQPLLDPGLGNGNLQRSWAEICCLGCTCLQLWPKLVLKKWLNISSSRDSDFSADEEDTTETESESEFEEMYRSEQQLERGACRLGDGPNEDALYRSRRRKSEALRQQYINVTDIRIWVGSWNLAGKVPPDDLDIEEWLHTEEHADIYVFGLQEIVPLNAGNVFGAEDNRPIPRWEHLIRQTLNKTQLAKPKYKCYSDPPSPSRFQPWDDVLVIRDEILPGTDSDSDEDIPKCEESFNFQTEKDRFTRTRDESNCNLISDSTIKADLGILTDLNFHKQSLKTFNRSFHLSFKNNEIDSEDSQQKKLASMPSSSRRDRLIWPEQSLDMVTQHASDDTKLFKSVKSFGGRNPSKLLHRNFNDSLQQGLISELISSTATRNMKRSPFVRIISKQMVGVYLSVWVRRSLKKHIKNLKVSSVGVGIMGYIGNKGSISISMSIYQTFVCFVCTHLTSGEKEGDELRRNADVQEIHRRTLFHSSDIVGLPKTIHDHERIIWLGDLNYRINLSYGKVHELASKMEWSKLAEKDQLKLELKKGRSFDGWSEGIINFPPTYKYEFNSEKYIGEEPKAGRRTPAWCDRILSYGKGIKLLDYRRCELKLSDHRPVTATFLIEVEVVCHRKLQRALTFTDAEIAEELLREADADFV